MTAINEPSFPKVLRLSGPKLAAAYVGIPLLAVLIAILVTEEIARGIDTPSDALVLAPFVILIPGLLLLLWMGTQTRTTLWPDRVEVFNGFKTRGLSGADIGAFRRERGQGHVALIAKDATVKPLRVPVRILAERSSVPWLEALHNIARDELAMFTAEVESNPRLGATQAERHQRLRTLRRAGKLIAAAGWLVAGWVWFWPHPYEMAMLAAVAVPLIAIALSAWSSALFRIDYWTEDPRPSIAALYFAPSLAIFVRALIDINAVDFWGLLLSSIAAGAALTVLVVFIDKRLRARRWLITGIAVGSITLALGALAQANKLLDTAPAQIFQTRIVDAYVTGGKVHLDELELAPWGPYTKSMTAQVAAPFFDSLKAGDAVCVNLHTGALGWRWFSVDRC